jgi:hypothetical protein
MRLEHVRSLARRTLVAPLGVHTIGVHAVGLLALAGPAAAQEDAPRASPRRAHATRTATPPQIDGKLDEPAWQTAEPIGELVQVLPVQGAPPSETSDVRILFDADAIYFGMRFFDREPAGIIATTRERDRTLEADDRFKLVLDTFHDRRSAFYFVMNSAGAKSDALINDNGRDFNRPWDGIWDGAARVDELGWTAELAIPFKTLSFREGASVWGLNLERHIGRAREDARWSGPTLDTEIFAVADAGELDGLVGLRQGIGLDVVPFFVADWNRDFVDDDADLLGEPGVDAFYKITPNLTFSLTVNTDFAEAEVDARRVNLTRFPLFFPEQRDFFLQDAGLFGFASFSNTGGGADVIPFFSRRIGLSPAGEEVPILAGAKLTGRAGAYNLGLLDVQTGDLDGLDGQNLAVARVTRNVGEQSTIGIIGTAGDPSSSRTGGLVGADATYRSTSFRDGKTLIASGWALASDEEGASEDLAFGASLDYPNDLWNWGLSAKEIQADFTPSLGFVPRTDVRKYTGDIGYSPRLEGAIRQLSFSAFSEVITDTQDELETATFFVQLLGIEWESGDRVGVSVEHDLDEISEDDFPPPSPGFEIHPGVFVPVGEYDFDRYGIEFVSAAERPLSLSGGVSAGEFFDGDRLGTSLELGWRSGALLTTSIEYEQQDVDLPGGEFTTQLARLRAKFSFSPELSWNTLVQWDSDSETLGIQSRLRWMPTPLQEIFLVFNETFDEQGSSVVPLFGAFTFKISYTFRF